MAGRLQAQVVDVQGRSMRPSISEAARVQLERRSVALFIKLELYFSCLVRKRVYVREPGESADALPLTDKLRVRFRPMVSETCAMREVERDNPPVRDMPMIHPERYFPRWLTLDYTRGEWRAEFGYAQG